MYHRVWAWYSGYMEAFGKENIIVPARGYTFDDPDMHANWSILVGVILYVVYEAQVYADPASYETNFLYITADTVYLVNSLCYLVAGLREIGWFWFMPSYGRFDYIFSRAGQRRKYVVLIKYEDQEDGKENEDNISKGNKGDDVVDVEFAYESVANRSG